MRRRSIDPCKSGLDGDDIALTAAGIARHNAAGRSCGRERANQDRVCRVSWPGRKSRRGSRTVSERREGGALDGSLKRGLEIVNLIWRSQKPLRPREIIDQLGLPRSSAYELIATLESQEYIER